MQRRRYVATQEESAPGPDGLPYSVYRLSTSSSRSTSARPSFFYGLGHMHGGVFSRRTCCLFCGLHAGLQILRRELDFIFGTMKHSCYPAVSKFIADVRTDLSSASATNPATAFDFSAASAATFVASIDVSVTNFAVSSRIACRSASCTAMHFFSKSRYSKHFTLHILTLFVISGCVLSFSAHTLSSTSCLPSKLCCLSLRAACCNSKSSLHRARGLSRGAVAPLSAVHFAPFFSLFDCRRTQARQAPPHPVLRFCDAGAFSDAPKSHMVSARSFLHQAFCAQALEVTLRAFAWTMRKSSLEFTVVNIEPILKGRRILWATYSLQACVYIRLANVLGNPSRTRKGFSGLLSDSLETRRSCGRSFSIPNETPSAAKPACGTRVVLESWTTWVRRAGYWRHGRQELLTAKFFLNSLCGGRQVLPQRIHDHLASSVHACSADVPLDGGCSFLVHTTDRPCERGVLVKE